MGTTIKGKEREIVDNRRCKRKGKRKTRGNKENVNDKREIVIGSRNSKEKRKKNIDNRRREEIKRSMTQRGEE